MSEDFAEKPEESAVAIELIPRDDGTWILIAATDEPGAPRVLHVPVNRSDTTFAVRAMEQSGAGSGSLDLSMELCRRILAPVAETCTGAVGVYLCPHGDLLRLPLVTTPVRGGRCLVEQMPVGVLPVASFIRHFPPNADVSGTSSAAILRGGEMIGDDTIARTALTVGVSLEKVFADVRRIEHPVRCKDIRCAVVVAHGTAAAGETSSLYMLRRSGRGEWMSGGELARMLGYPEITFLAVCRSATSWVAPGDEPRGLIWPLVERGGASVSALWDAEPVATAVFAGEFFRSISFGASAGRAFASAVGNMRGMGDRFAARDWAAFALYGDYRCRLTS
jgi:hypothetical protein